MKKKSILDNLFSFAKNYCRLKKEDRVAVAVSGGVDSMVLLWLASQWKQAGYLQEVRALHFNHGTRVENSAEEDLVRIFCNKLGVPLHVEKLNLAFQSNFEAKARDLRAKHARLFLQENELLLTAHHLDDSFEWSLMQRFKSGHPAAGLGIPVVNGPLRRPFMTLSKKQIIHLAERFEIPFLDDRSNLDTRFERNYIRQKVVPLIAKRFPQYLKHYISQSNQLAHRLGLHILQKNDSVIWKEKQDASGGIWLYRNDLGIEMDGAEEYMADIIHRLSAVKRGVIREQIERGIRAAKNSQHGPLLFSGKVWGYFYPGAIFFIADEKRHLLVKQDDDLLHKLKIWQKNEDSQIPSIDSFQFATIIKKRLSTDSDSFPHLLIATRKDVNRFWPTLKKIDPLFPQSTAYIIEKGLYYRFCLNFLRHWQRKGERFCFAIRDI